MIGFALGFLIGVIVGCYATRNKMKKVFSILDRMEKMTIQEIMLIRGKTSELMNK